MAAFFFTSGYDPTLLCGAIGRGDYTMLILYFILYNMISKDKFFQSVSDFSALLVMLKAVTLHKDLETLELEIQSCI